MLEIPCVGTIIVKNGLGGLAFNEFLKKDTIVNDKIKLLLKIYNNIYKFFKIKGIVKEKYLRKKEKYAKLIDK